MSYLSYIIIYNSDLKLEPDELPTAAGVPSSDEDGPPPERDEDAEEAAQIVFYSASNHITTRDKMLRHLGLAKGLENFADIFAPAGPSTVVTSTKSSLVTICPEAGYRVHVNVTLPPASSPSTSSRPAKQDIQLPVELIEAALHRSYASFVLLNGRFSQIVGQEGRKSLDRKVERFWNVWTADWQAELESGAALSVEKLLGEALPPLPTPSSSSAPSILLTRTTAHHLSQPDSFPAPLLQHLLSLLPPIKVASGQPNMDSEDAKRPPKPSSAGPSSDHNWLGLPSLGMGNMTWGGRSSGESASADSKGVSRLRTGSHPISATAGRGKTVERKSSSRWYTGAGLMDLLTPGSPVPTPAGSTTPSPSSSVSTAAADGHPAQTATGPPVSDEVASAPIATEPVDATALSDAIDTHLSEPTPPPEQDEGALQAAWEARWRRMTVWLPSEVDGVEVVQQEVWWILIAANSSLLASGANSPDTLYAYIPRSDSPTSTHPPLSLILSLLKDAPPSVTIGSADSTPTPSTVHYTFSGAHASEAWFKRAGKKSTAAATERSLIRSVNMAKSDPEVIETIARTSLSPAKWIVAKRTTPPNHVGDKAESGLVMILEGKGVGLGDVDARLRAVEKDIARST